MSPLTIFSFAIIAVVATTAFGENILEIHNTSDFISFSNSVSSETNYSGKTVFLENDIDFTEELSKNFNPINFFEGTFDGQGHVIRNLTISSSLSQYSGLFGYSSGTTIKNIIIDNSCSFTNKFISDNNNAFTGGVLAYCETKHGPCNIENCVNMANILFDGGTEKESCTGGILGKFLYKNNQTIIKNCANYGTISNTGTSISSVYIGGIVGSSYGGSSKNPFSYLFNCFNQGTINHNGITNDINIGGITGYSFHINIDNCVSSGGFNVLPNIDSVYVGSIAGYALETMFSHCYWNAESINNICEYYDPDDSTFKDNRYFDNTSFELNDTVTIGNYIGTSLIDALNAGADYYLNKGYSHWLLNNNESDITFNINSVNRTTFTLYSQIILLPSLADSEDKTFYGWYTDDKYTSFLTNFTVNNDTELYGEYKNTNCTVYFDVRGGPELFPISVPFKSIVQLPTNITKSDYTFLWWEDVQGNQILSDFIVSSRNVTLYAAWARTYIKTPEDLIELSEKVNSGFIYENLTVSLENDIYFTEKLSKNFNPIHFFRGTFDGKGHVIRNLNISSISPFLGLFGFSSGTIVKNTVIDKSCFLSFKNTVERAFLGFLIGCCETSYGPCTSENNVNMGSISFVGNTDASLSIGGIVGMFSSSNYPSLVLNCVNYGTISISGTNTLVVTGGIMAYSITNVNIYNCINYGSINFNGTPSNPWIGGISGYTYYANIDNCVSSGVVSSTKTTNIGSITGYSGQSIISNCYCLEGVGYNKLTGYKSETQTSNSYFVKQFNEKIFNKLNSVAGDNGWNKWFMLHLNGGKINGASQDTLLETQSNFPEPVKEGNTFLYWCKDYECNEVYDQNISNVTSLYAAWNNIVVSFDFENGTIINKTLTYGEEYGEFPESIKEGHTFIGWFVGGDKEVTEKNNITITGDHTIYGHWTVNNYTVKLDFGNGTVITVSLKYNSTIIYPENPTREGYTFGGWDYNITYVPANNITFTALWNYIPFSSSSSLSSSSSTTTTSSPSSLPSSSSPSSFSSSSLSSSSHKSSSTLPSTLPSTSSKSNTGAIVGGVVGAFAAVVIIILLIVLILFLRRDNDRVPRNEIELAKLNPRIVEKSTDATTNGDADTNISIKINESLVNLYLNNYIIPSIPEALHTTGLDTNKVKHVSEACSLVWNHVKRENTIPEGLTKEDIEAVALYTFDFGPENYTSNPYRIINNALVSNDDDDLLKASGVLFLVMRGLRKLPRFTGNTLYRGIREGVNVGAYKEGKMVVWHGLSSTSPDMNGTKAFLANSPGDKKKKGTLFIISGGWGYDIQPYSMFPEEAEILLEPGRQFRVQSVIDANPVVITLEMMDTPLILPEIFGEGNN